MSRNLSITAALAFGAVVLSSLVRGGFTPGGQELLIVLGFAALLAAVNWQFEEIGRLARRVGLLWGLAVLGALSVASALWTIGAKADAIRWGLVLVACAATAFAAGVVAVRVGAWPAAIVIAGLAAIEAVLGLGFAALHSLPDAQRIGSAWRPGGTFEYPPALALLQVAALPVCLMAAGNDRSGRLEAALSLPCAALAGAVLGAAGSRLAIVLAAASVAAVVASQGKRDRGHAVPVAVVAAAAGLAGNLLIAGRPGFHNGKLLLLTLFAILVLLSAAGFALRLWMASHETRPPKLAAVIAAIALVALTAAGVLAANREAGHAPGSGGLTHSRTTEWRVAVDTWLDRPVLGAGAETYVLAAVPHEPNQRVRYAHDLPLELAAELGIGGVLAALVLYVCAALLIWKARRLAAACLLAPFVAAFLIANLVDWPWHLAGLTAAWALAAGTLAGCLARESNAVGSEPAATAAVRRSASRVASVGR